MKSITIFFLTTMTTFCFAQNNEGVITYESVMRIDLSRFPPEMKGMIPPERKSKNQLIFNEKESIYKLVKEAEDINRDVTAGGERIQFKMAGAADNEFYTNLEDGSTIDKTEFFGRTFLISGGEEIVWKITSETQMIGDYQCMKATCIQDTIPVTAWFTPQIPISLGPAQYRGLPGMILSLDINDGQRTIKAMNVALRELTVDEVIEAPEKGKRVTQEEFEKIRKEKMDEMQEMSGGSGRTFIIRN